MAKQNSYARTKKKIKMLKLKAFWKRVFDKRREKRIKNLQPKGNTFTGIAKSCTTCKCIVSGWV